MQRSKDPPQSALDLARRPAPLSKTANQPSTVQTSLRRPVTAAAVPADVSMPHSLEGIIRAMQRQREPVVPVELGPSPGAIHIMNQYKAAAAANAARYSGNGGQSVQNGQFQPRPQPTPAGIHVNSQFNHGGFVAPESAGHNFGQRPAGQVRIRSKILNKEPKAVPSVVVINSVYNSDTMQSAGVVGRRNMELIHQNPQPQHSFDGFNSGNNNGGGYNGFHCGNNGGGGYSRFNGGNQNGFNRSNGFSRGASGALAPVNRNGSFGIRSGFVQKRSGNRDGYRNGNGYNDRPNDFNNEHMHKRVKTGLPITGGWKDVTVSKADLDEDLDAYMEKAAKAKAAKEGVSSTKLGWCEKAAPDEGRDIEMSFNAADDSFE